MVNDVQPLQPRTGRLTLIFLAFVVVAVAIGAVVTHDGAETATTMGGPMQGQPAPEVILKTFDGATWRLSDYLEEDGRPLFVNLWASWCEPCREEIPALSAFAAAHPEYAVVGVSVRDNEDEARSLVDELEPDYPIGIDATGGLRDKYLGFGLPATFLIDRTGTITVQIEGPVTFGMLEELTTG